MTRSWQERVAWHHIDGNPRNNDRANLTLVHVETGKPLTQRETDNYCSYLTRKLCNMMKRRE